MKTITYQIKLLEPVLVSELAGDPNSAVSFDYLPGSALRGVFIGHYLKSCQLNVDLAIDEEARRLFFSSATRWLHAYPLDRLNQRALPRPRSFHSDKNGDEDTIFDLAVDEPESDEKHQYKWESNVGAPFGISADGKLRLVNPLRQFSVHTARTRRYGRARSEEQKLDKQKGDTRGAVYRYDALAAEQSFAASVLCSDVDSARIKQLLDAAASQPLRLGKAQTGGYGLAQIEKVSKPQANWQEYAWPKCLQSDEDGNAPLPISGRLFVRLLSDVFLRDENTGHETAEAKALCDLLKTKLDGALSCQPVFVSHTILGGFNRKWGLPLPQARALAAGSVFTIEANNLDPQKLIDLMAEGVGERRTEGFGRLAFDWELPTTLTVDKTKLPSSASTVNLVDTPDADLALLVSQRILRRRLAQRVTATALKFEVNGKPPHKNQLARLRGLTQEELMKPQPDSSRVIDFIKDLEKRKTTKKQFEAATVGDQALNEWLLAQLAKIGADDWRNFFYEAAEYPAVHLGGIKTEPTEEMRKEHLLRWLATFLQHLSKQKGDK